MTHPEQVPNVKPLNKFTFSIAVGKQSKKDLDLQVEALEERIKKINDRVIIKDIPMIQSLLQLTRKREDLELLGNALLRVAPLLEQLDELKKRHGLADFAVNHPELAAAMFGDFDFDGDVSSITEEGNQ